jgi:hypothetical protein
MTFLSRSVNKGKTMLFEIENDKFEKCTTAWNHKELEIEKLIVSRISDENPVLDEEIFGEELFYINRQLVNSDKKRTDIIAIDKNGSLVVIELKKDEGRLGVEMQALQYLSNLSQYKGEDFLKKCYKSNNYDDINQFLNDGLLIKDINQKGRIILMARYFDRALFSMGKWLSDQGVSFKCISYEPIEFNNHKLLNFSVIFDQASFPSQYKLTFSDNRKIPDIYWHIIGSDNEKWWDYLKSRNQISTSFDNQPGDRGEEILKNYIKGDKILAYVSGVGCVGYGEIEDAKYTLVNIDSEDNFFRGNKNQHLHRLSIKWKFVVSFKNAISASTFEKEYGISHPVQTSSKIKKGNVSELIDELKNLSLGN